MKAAALFLVGTLLLCFSLLVGRQVFPPIERRLMETAASAPEDSQTAQIANYKRMKLAFISFDLFNGLTRKDIEDSPDQRSLAFYGLIAALLAVVFLGHFRPKKT